MGGAAGSEEVNFDPGDTEPGNHQRFILESSFQGQTTVQRTSKTHTRACKRRHLQTDTVSLPPGGITTNHSQLQSLSRFLDGEINKGMDEDAKGNDRVVEGRRRG